MPTECVPATDVLPDYDADDLQVLEEDMRDLARLLLRLALAKQNDRGVSEKFVYALRCHLLALSDRLEELTGKDVSAEDTIALQPCEEAAHA